MYTTFSNTAVYHCVEYCGTHPHLIVRGVIELTKQSNLQSFCCDDAIRTHVPDNCPHMHLKILEHHTLMSRNFVSEQLINVL